MMTKVTQISLMIWVALGKHQIIQQLVGHPCSVRFEKQSSMAENLFDWCWCARCTKTLSKSGFKHANRFLSLPRCHDISASIPSSISWMNARYEATTVGREMWITYNAVCIIIHQGLENVETFSSRPRPRPRPRPFFMSSLHFCQIMQKAQVRSDLKTSHLSAADLVW